METAIRALAAADKIFMQKYASMPPCFTALVMIDEMPNMPGK
ncbi:MAG: hypothetical protein QXX99_07850 [Candidatus Bathyarchaeia archaeon]